jgi:two-component system, NtrC family, response regulator PilR
MPAGTDPPENGRLQAMVVDDDGSVRATLGRWLSRTLKAEARMVATGKEAVEAWRTEAFDVALVDLCLDDIDGTEVVRQIRAVDPDAALIMMTGYGSVRSAVEAVKAGAFDYLAKPLDMAHLEVVLVRAVEGRRQAAELRLLKEQVEDQGSFLGLVGVSPPMQEVYDVIRRVAEVDVNVLIQGETGTGKELAARAIHRLSGRCDRVFLPVNCGALPESILESELFGHEKGAFTGAMRQKVGLIEQAQGGTLFLDEVEETSPALQVKLLRAIQEREVVRVGGQEPIAVDFRLVASANQDLKELVEAGDYRADLYYRINAIVVNLPPLRDRSSDVPLLARHFSTRFAQRTGRSAKQMEPEAMMALKSHVWPGNVRELENVVERANLMATGPSIGIRDLPDEVTEEPRLVGAEGCWEVPLKEARRQFERQYLTMAMERAEGNVTQAARLAGINRQHFYDRMKHCGITRSKTEQPEGAMCR